MIKEKNNSIWVIVAVVAVALIAGGFFAWRGRKDTTTPSVDTPVVSNISDEEAIAYLRNMNEVVYRMTYTVEFDYEDDNGQPAKVQRETTQKVSISPTLQVVHLERMRSFGEDEIDPNSPNLPFYTIFNGDGTTTNYAYNMAASVEEGHDVWYTGKSDDVDAGIPAERFYAHTWKVESDPVRVSDGVYEAPARLDEGGNYTFYFGADGKLNKVSWANPETRETAEYEILAEPVETTVPQAIIDAAVPFEE